MQLNIARQCQASEAGYKSETATANAERVRIATLYQTAESARHELQLKLQTLQSESRSRDQQLAQALGRVEKHKSKCEELKKDLKRSQDRAQRHAERHTELQKQVDSLGNLEKERSALQRNVATLGDKLTKNEELVTSLRVKLRNAREHSAEQLSESMASEPGEDRHEHRCASENTVYRAVTVDCPLGILRRWLERLTELSGPALEVDYGICYKLERSITDTINGWANDLNLNLETNHAPGPLFYVPLMNQILDNMIEMGQKLMEARRDSWSRNLARAPRYCRSEMRTYGSPEAVVEHKAASATASRATSFTSTGVTDDTSLMDESEPTITPGASAAGVARLEEAVRDNNRNLQEQIQTLSNLVQNSVMGESSSSQRVMEELAAVRDQVRHIRRDQVDRIQIEQNLTARDPRAGEHTWFNPRTGEPLRNSDNISAMHERTLDSNVLLPMHRQRLEHGREFLAELVKNIHCVLDLDLEDRTPPLVHSQRDLDALQVMNPRGTPRTPSRPVDFARTGSPAVASPLTARHLPPFPAIVPSVALGGPLPVGPSAPMDTDQSLASATGSTFTPALKLEPVGSPAAQGAAGSPTRPVVVKKEPVSPTPSVSLISSLEGFVINVSDSSDEGTLPQSESEGMAPTVEVPVSTPVVKGTETTKSKSKASGDKKKKKRKKQARKDSDTGTQ